MKLNRHNLPMIGIKYAAGQTKGLYGNYGPAVHIEYNPDNGHISSYYVLSPNSEIRECDEGNIAFMTSREMTMQEIADTIAWRMESGLYGWGWR